MQQILSICAKSGGHALYQNTKQTNDRAYLNKIRSGRPTRLNSSDLRRRRTLRIGQALTFSAFD